MTINQTDAPANSVYQMNRDLAEAELHLVYAEGQVTLNGRARRTVEALETLGKVEVDWDLVLHGNGRATERIVVRPPFGSVI